MAVRLRRHAFTDAPDTSVVLCFSGGREVRVVGTGDEGGRRGRTWRSKVEEEVK